MWKYVSSSNSNNPYIESLNNCIGRSTWEYDKGKIPSEEIQQKIQESRENFRENRLKQRDSKDDIYRIQNYDKIKKADIKVPKEPIIQEEEEGSVSIERVNEHIRAGIKYYECLQTNEGFWPGDYGGPLFLLPGMVIALYLMDKIDYIFGEEGKNEIIRYMRNHQNEDGGFGLHIEGLSTMFGTSLNYVMLRILNVNIDDEMMKSARKWICENGGVIYSTSWGKFWLAVLGVYDWDGLNPLTPETWILPHAKWTGIGLFHPSRYWCHCRMVYLPMSYIYGKRDKLKKLNNSLINDLKIELYTEPYDTIDWNSCRNKCFKNDLYNPHPLIQDYIWWILYKAESLLKNLKSREWALDEIRTLIEYEDENTRYVCIGPVNKSINMLCRWVDGPDSDAVKKHLVRCHDYLWIAEDGMKMQGYNGSQLWDTAFSIQAIQASGLASEFYPCLKKAHFYIHQTQVIENCEGNYERYHRHQSKGAWPFSTRDHGWPISDCTADGLKAALHLATLPENQVGKAISEELLKDSIDTLLTFQNSDGGYPTYEINRSYAFIEFLNPSETFKDIIVDYSYVELTGVSISALNDFRKKYPNHRREEIDKSIERGRDYILSIQRRDGSWYGSWGVCFTYGTWFGIIGLKAAGLTHTTSNAIRQACCFLLEKQKEDGGWGETYLSCQNKEYSELEGNSHAVNTAWALMSLIEAGYHHVRMEPLDRAAKFLMKFQLPEGDWPQQHISGVFNNNCMITYINYKYIFPIWALGLYKQCLMEI